MLSLRGFFTSGTTSATGCSSVLPGARKSFIWPPGPARCGVFVGHFQGAHHPGWCSSGGHRPGRPGLPSPFTVPLDGHLGISEVALEHLAARVGHHVDSAQGPAVEGPLVLLHDAFNGEALPLEGHRPTRLDLGEGGLRDADRVHVVAEVHGYTDQGLLPHEEHQVASAIWGEVHPGDIKGRDVGVGKGP